MIEISKSLKGENDMEDTFWGIVIVMYILSIFIPKPKK